MAAGGAPLAQLLPVCASFAVRQLEPSGTRARHSCEYSIASASSDGQMQSSSHSLYVRASLRTRRTIVQANLGDACSSTAKTNSRCEVEAPSTVTVSGGSACDVRFGSACSEWHSLSFAGGSVQPADAFAFMPPPTAGTQIVCPALKSSSPLFCHTSDTSTFLPDASAGRTLTESSCSCGPAAHASVLAAHTFSCAIVPMRDGAGQNESFEVPTSTVHDGIPSEAHPQSSASPLVV